MGEGVDRVDWVCVPLRQIFDVIGGGTPSTKNSEYWGGDIPWISSADIDKHGRMTPRKSITVAGVENSAINLVDAGHLILVSRVGLGKCALAPTRLAFSQDCQALLPKLHGISASFFRYQMSFLGTEIKSRSQGTTIPGITKQELVKIEVTLPPLVEQRAIVAKIEALFSELDKGVEQLETLRGQLKRYRQSVLKAAFEGKLTAEWRARQSQDPELLKAAETPETYGTKKPEGWTFVKAGKLTEFVTSGSRGWSKYCGSTGALFIRSQDINRDTLALESVTRVNPPGGAEGNRTRVKTGDLLLTITGANVGKCACVDREIPEAYVSQHVALLRLHDTVQTAYLHWLFLSDAFVRGQLHRVAYGAGKPGLNLENVKDAIIPLAPLPEQHQIVAEIEARFSALDQLEQTVEAGLKQTEALRQSILKKAFEGRLLSASERAAVRADPGYEPAARLLERIRGERAAPCGQGGQRGRATKSRSVSTSSTSSTPPTPKRRHLPWPSL